MARIKCFMLEPTGEKSEKGFTLYRRGDTGEVAPFLNNNPEPIPVGAMWYADWMLPGEGEHFKFTGPAPWKAGPDGRVLAVKTPGGTWIIDSRCSNCGLPEDDEHCCWVRHGIPPLITVDKNGKTCSAGGGSIQCGTYHGFLRSGYLED